MLSRFRIGPRFRLLPLTGLFLFASGCSESSGEAMTSAAIAAAGGLALLVFGMELMGDGIRELAGESMKKLLKYFSRNRFTAIFAGTLVTAALQSSNTTAVTAIGFVNAGLLGLGRAIGIFAGANLGATATVQLISFDLARWALPAVTLGFLLRLLRLRDTRGWGNAFFGFGLLFLGMALMSSGLQTLAGDSGFRAVFAGFDCRPDPAGQFSLYALCCATLAGAVATMLLRSNTAAMGVVLALAAAGLVNFQTAVPLLAGTNLGTVFTAISAAAAGNRVARQAALAHALFNLCGVLLLTGLFFVPYGPENTPVFLRLVNSLTPGDALLPGSRNIAHHIAAAHTLFNLCAALLLLPFIGPLARLCAGLLPIPADARLQFQPLEPNLLATPSIALKQTVGVIRSMVEDSWEMIGRAVNTHFIAGVADAGLYRELAEAENRIDATQAEVTAYLVRITRRPLTEPQSELVPLLMHCTNDAERIADHTELILQLTDRMLKTGKKVSLSGKKDLRKLWNVLDSLAANTVAALGSTNPEQVKLALKDEKRLRKMAAKYEADHTERLRKGKCQLTNAVIFIEMLGEMTKIGERLANIAERTPEIQKHYIEL